MIEFRNAEVSDAELVVDIYNAAFFDDYVKYRQFSILTKVPEVKFHV